MGSDLEKNVQILMDERAIMDTMAAYGHYIDHGLQKEWLDLFTEDGRYHVTLRGMHLPNVIVDQPEGGMTAKEREEYISKHTHAPDAWHKHCSSAPRITMKSETTASATSYFFRLDETEEGTSYVLVYGRYFDEFEKCADGKWRFKLRRIEMENGSPIPRAKMGGIELINIG